MKATEFAYWLQGFFELSENPKAPLSARQVDLIQRHLYMVFQHDIDPKAGSAALQEKLDEIHHGAGPAAKPPAQAIGGGLLFPGRGPVIRC